MPLPGDLLALLNACRADPVSDLPRLVLADWLDEHDDPARAEFLRVQCELARPSLDTERVAELKLRERALIAANWRAWAGGLHEVCCDLIDAESRARCEAEPVQPRRGRFARQPWDHAIPRDNPSDHRLPWKFTRGLITLRTTPLRIGSLRSWAKGYELPWIDTISMALGADLTHLNSASWVLPRTLAPYLSVGVTLSMNAGIGSLRAPGSRHWKRVRDVEIDGERYEGVGWLNLTLALADFSNVARLRLDSAAVANRICTTPFPHLVFLDVGGASLPPETLLAFAKRTPRLNVLSAWRTHLGDEGFAALVSSSWGETLHTLEVMNCDLGDDAMTALVRSGLLGRLYGPQLNLSMNRVGDAGLAALAGSEDLLRFGELVLRENRVKDAGVEALAASPFAANLRYLDLWKNRLTDRAAAALAASPHLGRLRDLNVRDNALTDVGRATLTARYGAVAKVGF